MMAPCTHTGMKRIFYLKTRKTALLLVERQTGRGGLILAEGRVRSRKINIGKKKQKKIRSTLTHHEIHSSPKIATTSRRLATKHVLRGSPYSRACTDSEFVTISLVQLSRPVNPTNVAHTHTATDRQDRQTDRQTHLIMALCTHSGMKNRFCPKGKKQPHSIPRMIHIFTDKAAVLNSTSSFTLYAPRC